MKLIKFKIDTALIFFIFLVKKDVIKKGEKGQNSNVKKRQKF